MPNVVHAAPNSFLVEFIYFKWLFVGQTTQFYLGQHFAVVIFCLLLLLLPVCSFFSGFPFIRNSSSSLSSYKFEAYNCIVSIIFISFYSQTLVFCCCHEKTAKKNWAGWRKKCNWETERHALTSWIFNHMNFCFCSCRFVDVNRRIPLRLRW